MLFRRFRRLVRAINPRRVRPLPARHRGELTARVRRAGARDELPGHGRPPPRRLFLQASTDANEASQGNDQRRPNTRLGITLSSQPGSCTAAAQTIDSPARTSTIAAAIVAAVPRHARVAARRKDATPMPTRTARPTGERYHGCRSSPVTGSFIPEFLQRGSRAVKSPVAHENLLMSGILHFFGFASVRFAACEPSSFPCSIPWLLRFKPRRPCTTSASCSASTRSWLRAPSSGRPPEAPTGSANLPQESGRMT